MRRNSSPNFSAMTEIGSLGLAAPGSVSIMSERRAVATGSIEHSRLTEALPIFA